MEGGDETVWFKWHRPFLASSNLRVSRCQSFAEVQIFNFDRTTDFELWDLERQYPSDMCAEWVEELCGAVAMLLVASDRS